jgi:hypothetical protein
MQAGDDVLTVEYKGTLTHASLTHDGRIRWKGVCTVFIAGSNAAAAAAAAAAAQMLQQAEAAWPTHHSKHVMVSISRGQSILRPLSWKLGF